MKPQLILFSVIMMISATSAIEKIPIEDFHLQALEDHPLVQSHTYDHKWGRNVIMYQFIGMNLWMCSLFGFFFSLTFDIQGWYWDCLDNTRTNLTLI